MNKTNKAKIFNSKKGKSTYQRDTSHEGESSENSNITNKYNKKSSDMMSTSNTNYVKTTTNKPNAEINQKVNNKDIITVT
jgi:hypothetical protein